MLLEQPFSEMERPEARCMPLKAKEMLRIRHLGETSLVGRAWCPHSRIGECVADIAIENPSAGNIQRCKQQVWQQVGAAMLEEWHSRAD